MWCPVCKAEYVEGITQCHDCQVALISQIPPEEEDAVVGYVQSDWVDIEEFNLEITARVAEGLLKENGIECRLEDLSFHANPAPSVSNLTLYRLWVPPEEVERADKILETVEDHPEICSICGRKLNADGACPECDSDQFRK